MKRIVAFVLAICCVFALFSCASSEKDTIKRIANIFDSNAPTKVVIETSQVIGDDAIELKGLATLTVGKYNGEAASVYEAYFERFATVEEGATEEKPNYIVKDFKKLEYLESKGLRTNGGSWDASADDIAPQVGAIKLNITNKNVSDVKYENGVLSFTVKAENTAEVLGEAYAQENDVYVEVAEYEGFVTSILLSYEVIYEDDDYPSQLITVKASYSYGIQTVNID